MKKIAALVLTLCIGQLALAQNILSSYSFSSSITMSTSSARYVYSRGGSPRTGYYYYWRYTGEQSTQAQGQIPLGGSSGTVRTVGTYFAPAYSATEAGTTAFGLSAVKAEFGVFLKGLTVFNPNLPDHAAASMTASESTSFSFTVDAGVHISIAVKGIAGGLTKLIDVSSGEVIFQAGQTGSFSDNLAPGTYVIETNLYSAAGHDTYTGSSYNLGTALLGQSCHVSIVPEY